jgi:Uma2 family endonuclease
MIESQPAEELSLADWAALPEDAQGELVDGRLTEEEVSDYVHEILVIAIGSILRAWILPRGGRVAGSDAKLAVSSERGRKPDLTVYLPGRLPPRRGLIRTPPDVAVEILTPTPRDERCDRVEKVGEYARFGVRSYWIVDTELRSLEILELGDDGRYVHALSATGGVLESIPGCEGLTLDLDALWDEIDWSETQ